MATLNLLQAKFTGKLGNVYGVSWKGHAVVRAVPFSKAPHTKLQRASVRAFECLVRLSSGIARAGFAHTGLIADKLLPHNAITRFLKPAIKNHIFEPALISEVIPTGENIIITTFNFDPAIFTGLLIFSVNPLYVPLPGEHIFCVIFDDTGLCAFNSLLPCESASIEFFIDYIPDRQYSLIMFISSPSGKSFKLSNFVFIQSLTLPDGYTIPAAIGSNGSSVSSAVGG